MQGSNMLFHHVYGSAITLSDDRTCARRSENHFCNGLVFTEKPVNVYEKLCLELGCITVWSGGLRIGVTTTDPSSLTPAELPKYAFPDLTSREGFWFSVIQECQLDTGTKVTLYIDSAGNLQVFINNHHKGVILGHLPTNRPLWLVFDLYGNTAAAKFVHPDDAPTEILARGPEAVRAYEEACSSGVQSLFRTRLMLVGQEGVGKTSLRRSLVGQKYQENEKSTDGIDLSASCSFNLQDKSAWRLAIQGQTTQNDVNNDAGSDIVESAEDVYNRAIAANIVHELVYQRRQSQESTKKNEKKPGRNSPPKPRSSSPSKVNSATTVIHRHQSQDKEKIKRRSKSCTFNPSPSSSELSIPPEVLQSVPDRVAQLVQEMLQEKNTSRKSSARNTRSHSGSKSVQLNIWDFAGQTVYYTTHQVFLTSRAVYVIVFNLCHNLEDNQVSSDPTDVTYDRELSPLGYMDFWMRSIHAHAAENARRSVDQSTLSPPIFIVGTHRHSLHSDPVIRQEMVDHRFQELEFYIKDKPYAKHIVTPFFAVENSEADDEMILELRHEIEQVSSRESYMGEQRPLKWLRFEHRVEELVSEGTHYATYDQVEEIASEEDIRVEGEVKTMLQFYHDLGLLIYYGGASVLDNVLRNTVILDPRWLIDMFKRIIAAVEVKDKAWLSLASSWEKLEDYGILTESLIDHLWEDVIDQKQMLLNLMERFDLICNRQPPLIDESEKSYYVPVKLKPYQEDDSFYTPSPDDVIFYLDFNGFLPEGLFYRILTRAVRWSQSLGGQEPQLYRRSARFFLDAEHDFFLEMMPHPFCRIKVTVANMTDNSDSDTNDEDQHVPIPNPKASAKVRHFLDSTLSDLKAMWMRRIFYRTTVECPCVRVCKRHEKTGCQQDTCLHFLDLDECLTNKVVLCDHRRIKTNPFKKCFPIPPHLSGRVGPVLPSVSLKETHGNLEKQCPNLPSWVKGAAKLLNGSPEEQDWINLAKLLGYKQLKIDQFNDDLNPALVLLTDWIITSGNTALSVDVLVTYLEQLNRDDIVDVVQSGQETSCEPAQVFISYQWDSQEEVRALRDRLEQAGFTCWMDIGQMGGGDQLYNKIDMGIRHSKVILACVTPKYTVSHYCNRELNLADLIHKPIVPIVFDHVTWPPPGGMSLVFAQLVYINMKGVGGHGGSGVHADLEDKYSEIIQRISQYVKPISSPQQNRSLILDDTKLSNIHSNASITGLDQLSAFSQHDQPEPPQTIPSLTVASSTQAHGLSPSRSMAQAPVERVHISKCGVCTLL